MVRTAIHNIPKKGRGVIACQNIRKGTLIEECPVLLFDVPEGRSHLLECFAFRWSKRKIALALGNGSLYNHSYTPNSIYVQDTKRKLILIYAIVHIKSGSEICFNYNGNPTKLDKLWFRVKK